MELDRGDTCETSALAARDIDVEDLRALCAPATSGADESNRESIEPFGAPWEGILSRSTSPGGTAPKDLDALALAAKSAKAEPRGALQRARTWARGALIFYLPVCCIGAVIPHLGLRDEVQAFPRNFTQVRPSFTPLDAFLSYVFFMSVLGAAFRLLVWALRRRPYRDMVRTRMLCTIFGGYLATHVTFIHINVYHGTADDPFSLQRQLGFWNLVFWFLAAGILLNVRPVGVVFFRAFKSRADWPQMRAFLRTACSYFGRVDTIIHPSDQEPWYWYLDENTRRPWGIYGHRGERWKEAVPKLLRKVKIAVVDLAGGEPYPQGLAYEIEVVSASRHVEVVFIADALHWKGESAGAGTFQNPVLYGPALDEQFTGQFLIALMRVGRPKQLLLWHRHCSKVMALAWQEIRRGGAEPPSIWPGVVRP